MSANNIPDAWKELGQLLETRKQVLDNALLRTLDDKCSASYFQVARSLMLDHEKMLHWFISQQAVQNSQPAASPAATIAKPAAMVTANTVKRAGFLKPGLLALLGFIFFFVVVIVALIQGQQPVVFSESVQNCSSQEGVVQNHQGLAHDLHSFNYGFQKPDYCCIMERIHVPEFKTAPPRKMDDAFTSTRFAYTHQKYFASCHQGVPQPAGA